MAALACSDGVDVAALQEIVEASYAIPAISVGFEDESVPAALVGPAVVFRQQINQELAGLSGEAGCKRDLPRFRIEIVHEQHGIVAPVIADGPPPPPPRPPHPPPPPPPPPR